jgi:hypothetical protein
VPLAVSAPEDCEPIRALAPDQAPEAAQEVAFLDDHAKVDALPLAIVFGLALKLTVTVGLALTVTVADCAALPPVPEQVNVYVALAERAPVDCDPVTALDPDQAPEATHEVAFAAFQLSVELVPLARVLGEALMLIVGATGFTDTVAVCAAPPSAPVQVKV